MTTEAAKPKRAPTAYFLFANTVREGLSEENKKKNDGKVKVGEVAKAVGELWAKLSAEKKAEFEEQAKSGKEKHAADMQAYKEANDPVKALKEKYADLIPKRAPSAYWIFSKDESTVAKAEKAVKDAGEEVHFKKVTVKVAELWKALSDKEKAPWEEQSKAAAVEHEKKKKIWEASPEFQELQRVEKEHKEAQKEAAKDDTTESDETPKKGAKRKAAESEGDAGSSPPTKKAKAEKKAKAPKPARATKPQPPVIDADVLKKAESLNLVCSLQNLMIRPEVKDIPQAKMLTALVESEGLVNKAKNALLGGA